MRDLTQQQRVMNPCFCGGMKVDLIMVGRISVTVTVQCSVLSVVLSIVA